MKHRIYVLTDYAINNNLSWDDAIRDGEIETFMEFENYEDAVNEFENGGYDPDVFGVE